MRRQPTPPYQPAAFATIGLAWVVVQMPAAFATSVGRAKSSNKHNEAGCRANASGICSDVALYMVMVVVGFIVHETMIYVDFMLNTNAVFFAEMPAAFARQSPQEND